LDMPLDHFEGASDITSVYIELLRNHITNAKSQHEFLLWMLLLHTHKIKLASHSKSGANPILLLPVTQRIAAEVVAELWPDQQYKEKMDYRFWYREFVLEYGGASAIPSQVEQELVSLREKLQCDNRVQSIDIDCSQS